MFVKFETFPERENQFFNSMLEDLNPKIYAISKNSFVFQEKRIKVTGNVDIPNANVYLYINGTMKTSGLADGSGKFTLYIRLENDENNIVVKYD